MAEDFDETSEVECTSSSCDSPSCASARRVTLKRGHIYWWCRCGKSRKLPFCDNAHKDTDVLPEVIKAESSGEFLWCVCGKSGLPPECDGSGNLVKEELYDQ